jgi:hypothetical protein
MKKLKKKRLCCEKKHWKKKKKLQCFNIQINGTFLGLREKWLLKSTVKYGKDNNEYLKYYTTVI